jgi:hypothetical protein
MSVWRRVVGLGSGAVLVASTLVAGGCGQTRERSLCPVYGDFLAARQEVLEITPAAARASSAAAVVEDYLVSIARLAEVTDGRYHTAVADLEAAVADVLRTLEGVDPDEDPATWEPLIEESAEDARSAADRVEDLIDPQCSSGGDQGSEQERGS